MNVPHPEKRHIKVLTGELPAAKIASLAACHPFTQQLDIVFPSNSSLLDALEKLETSYRKGKTKLSDVLNNSDRLFDFPGDTAHNFVVVTSNSQEEDVWCIDSRAHLTLSVTKETYERLGLVGQKLPFKNHSERQVVDIPLRKNVQPPAIRKRQKTCLENWDKRREEQLGKDGGLWDVVYCMGDDAAPPHGVFQELGVCRVQCKARELKDVHVPIPGLSSRPEPAPTARGSDRFLEDTEEGLVEWDERVQSLFEWIGLACLGAQRLYANDRVDPYVALYEHPTPSRVGDVTHLQWKGLLHPAFVGKVLDTLISFLQNSKQSSFVGITSHALTTSPISYIPYTTTAPNGTLQIPGRVPAHLPRVGGEDTWSLILERALIGELESTGTRTRWCLGESHAR